jgi:L-asparaginase II
MWALPERADMLLGMAEASLRSGEGDPEGDDTLETLRALVGEARGHLAGGRFPAAMARMRVAEDLVSLGAIRLGAGGTMGAETRGGRSPDDAPLVAVRRGAVVESLHRGRWVAVQLGGDSLAGAGDADGFVWLRSSAKPFQALPLILSGAADELGLTAEEIAVACGSHSGEPRHLAAVRALLRRAGLSEADLQNGTHPPMHAPSAARLARSGEEPRRIHGNCSGKHAGMLAVCAHAGWDTSDYRDPDGPLQRLVRRAVAEVCGLRPEELRLAGDGCGVPVFGMPLRNLALGFARLAGGGEVDDGLSEEMGVALGRVRDAMLEHPYLVAGTGRFDTRIMESARDIGLVAKGGAEGVFACGGHRGDSGENHWGMALKISDGTGRAVAPAAVAALRRVGLPVDKDLGRREVKDLRGEVVGEITALP